MCSLKQKQNLEQNLVPFVKNEILLICWATFYPEQKKKKGLTAQQRNKKGNVKMIQLCPQVLFFKFRISFLVNGIFRMLLGGIKFSIYLTIKKCYFRRKSQLASFF